MERLTGMDAAFVHMETPDVHLHVTALLVLDPSTMPGGYSFEAIRDTIAGRIHLIPALRRRLVEVPLALGPPMWIEAAGIDVDDHIHRTSLPAPHSDRELAALAGDIASVPLDRRRPPWEMWLVEGLESGRVALVAKVHHSTVDGVTGTQLMTHLLDLDPEPRPTEPGTGNGGEPEPSELRLVAGALGDLAVRPWRFARVLATLARGAVRVGATERRAGASAAPPAVPFTAPHTPFNRSIGPRRAIATARVRLDHLKLVKNTFGTTVNDVVLAACTMSLRRWLLAHGGLPACPLVATLPVAVATEPSREVVGANHVSVMMVSLPVLEADPVAQLRAVAGAARTGKRIHEALGPNLVTGLAAAVPPFLLALFSRTYSGLNLADRHWPVHNLVISNVPGPTLPLYLAGAKVVASYPMGPILEGAGLNITVLSYMGDVDFCAIADRELVTDLWDLADGFADAVTRLTDMALLTSPATGVV
jgi:WS/DGAT/MGAT family acyltransferase